MIYNFWDFDDTLVLTRVAIYKSYRHAFRKVMNLDLPWGVFNSKLYANANSYMAQLGFTDKHMREVKKEKNKIYLERNWTEVVILKDDFSSDEEHIIVSNTTSDVIEAILNKIDMAGPFSNIIGSDIYLGVNRKPAPDLYTYAFSTIKDKFDIETDWIVIHEDSPYGLHAALTFYEEHKDKLKNFRINYIPQNFN